jgi:hypothetical protein
MGWVDHVASVKSLKNAFKIIVRKSEGILKWALKMWSGRLSAGSIWLRIDIIVGSCEDVNERSGSIKDGHFLAKWAFFSFCFKEVICQEGRLFATVVLLHCV